MAGHWAIVWTTL